MKQNKNVIPMFTEVAVNSKKHGGVVTGYLLIGETDEFARLIKVETGEIKRVLKNRVLKAA